MAATTTRSDQQEEGEVITSYVAAPTRTVSVDGVDFAYRELGPATGVPVIFLHHLAAVLDNRGETDRMVPTSNSFDLAQRVPNADLVVYPDAGHGGIFQFHQQFVESALAFLGGNS